jgi:hypothetical protein
MMRVLCMKPEHASFLLSVPRARLQRDQVRPADDPEQPPRGGDVGVVDAQQRELGVHLAKVCGALSVV